MSQTSREIVKAAINFQCPERLPVRMDCYNISDIYSIPRASYDKNENEIRTDEWGCIWEQTEEKNMGQVKGHLINDLSEVKSIKVPDYYHDWLYVDCEKFFKEAEKEKKYTQTGIFFVLFERMQAIVGFENILMGLISDRENAELLADKIADAQIVIVREFQKRFGKRLDSFTMTDNWGTQNAAFISSEMWYDIFFPRYKRIFDAMHEGGQDVWVHSCGKINEIVQGYIDAGVNVVNLQQPRALGIKDMGDRYQGKISFESLADIQATLPKNDENMIVDDAQELGKYWMSPEGGFIFSDYVDGEAIGADSEAKRKMYEAFSKVSEQIYGNSLPEIDV
ncbi:MAG: uroporphyrinogen decarboxylase family protein [Verrucomicrobiota bacterium]|nr:uroporphyrinogen decarboxylase family protein [Verrucomicrobiota bacterium]